jgi:hypothetical protein
MKFNPKKDMGLGALAVLLGGLSFMNTSPPADAAIYCNDLRCCTGNAGCSGDGSVTGCSIKCAGGGTVNCGVRPCSG